jgi:MinD-like ATPase involved in chromosome partitioning or flagellar assembly
VPVPVPVPVPGQAFDPGDIRPAAEQAIRRGLDSDPTRPAATEPETRAAAPAPVSAQSAQRRHAQARIVPAVAAVPGGGRRPARVAPAAPALDGAGSAPHARTVVPSGPAGVGAASVEPLTEEGMVRRRGAESGTGWRRALFLASGGAVRVPAGVAQRRRDAWVTRIRTELPDWHTVTVASIKGGIGKTTLAALVGLALAEHRGDRVVALDANPDAGTLADRLLGGPALRTVRDLIAELDAVDTSTEMARYTAMAHRLHVLASDQDPAMSEAFSKSEYDQVLRLLKRFYNIIITDSGTGLIRSAMGGALESTRTLVIAGAPMVDGGSRASKTLDWLHAHGFDELAADAIVVLSQDRSSREVDGEAIAEHFRRRCRAVVNLPLDPHLMTGGQIVFDRLRTRTRDAALEIAAHVGDQFGWDWPERADPATAPVAADGRPDHRRPAVNGRPPRPRP